MRTILIGDVHGMHDELHELLARLNPQKGDRFVFVGDLVDKGPDSLGVLRLVKEVVECFPGSVVVSGNHEEKASRMWKRGTAVEPWANDATDDDWAFIDSMPLTWNDPVLNLRVVHGGIFPALLEKHPDAFERIEARGNGWRKGGGKVMDRSRRMLRVRFVNGEGDMLALGENKQGDPFWAETWSGPEFVVFGHSPWIDGEVRKFPHALGIDTGAVFGGKLTAAVFTGRDQFEIVQVDGRKFAEPLVEEDD